MKFQLSLPLPLILSISFSILPSTEAQLPAAITSSPLLSGVSAGCLSSLVTLISSDLSSCLHLTSASTLLSNQNSSLAGPLNDFLTDRVCSNQPCSQQILSTSNTTIRNGCQDELSSGIDGANVTLPVILNGLVQNYETVRQAGCLVDSNADDETCLAQYIYTIQNVTGQTLSVNNVMDLASNMAQLTRIEQQLAANETAFCTPCTQALYSTLEPTIRSSFNQSIQQNITDTLNNVCGAGFSTAGIPNSIKNGAAESQNDTPSDNDTDAALRISDGNPIALVGLTGLFIVGVSFVL